MAMEGRALEKRQQIIDAARHLILRDGIRATTMEAVAREAGIAKQTLYRQFPDKDAVVSAVIEHIVDKLCGAVDLGLAGAGPVTRRVGNALAEKFAAIEVMIGDSPHSDELFSEHSRIATRFAGMEQDIERQITAALADAGARNASELARIIMAASYGIGRKLSGEDAIHRGIMALCEAVIGAELGKNARS